MVTSSSGGWFETIFLLDVVFQTCPFWKILTSFHRLIPFFSKLMSCLSGKFGGEKPLSFCYVLEDETLC